MTWKPIKSAPLDGTYILVTNHEAGASWVASYHDAYQSGYKPENPWSSIMLNHRHFKDRFASLVPTHWQHLPVIDKE